MEIAGKGELRKLIAFLKKLEYHHPWWGSTGLAHPVLWYSLGKLNSTMDPGRNHVQAFEELQCMCFKQSSKTKPKLLCYHL